MGSVAGLHYEASGPEGGEPVILSAGLGGSGGYWAPNVAALSARHRVIAYDHRGTGKSDRALPDDVTVAGMAEDVLLLMDGLDLAKAHLIGHALGGLIGLALAMRAPSRLTSLVAVNAWAKLDPHSARCFDTRLHLLRDSGPRAYLHAQPLFLYPPAWISNNGERLAADEAAHLAHFPGGETLERRIAAARAFDVSTRLAEITTPVLALASADDMLVPPPASARLAEGLPNGRLAVTPGGGHAFNVTEPETFDRLVLDWLSEPRS